MKSATCFLKSGIMDAKAPVLDRCSRASTTTAEIRQSTTRLARNLLILAVRTTEDFTRMTSGDGRNTTAWIANHEDACNSNIDVCRHSHWLRTLSDSSENS